ncbi:MAG: DinB family protein [Ignavibacteria bacterium]
MNFSISSSIEILSRTPDVLETLLKGLSNEWIYYNEGDETWSPFDIVGHLIHGEKTDWMSRVDIILDQDPDKRFKPFDRFAQIKLSKEKSLDELLIQFKELRKENLNKLQSINITAEMLDYKGIHPTFGEVTLHELISTWVVHDLGHIAQISRVMSKQYKSNVGPWIEYLPVLTK